MDRLTPERRSYLMSQVRSKDTLPELLVRSCLHKLGFRFRVHVSSLPGRPDLVFPGRRKAVFVHGCYWHGHSCRFGTAQSKSNVQFWRDKLAGNRRRDLTVIAALQRKGWKTHIVWECQIKDGSWLFPTLAFLENW